MQKAMSVVGEGVAVWASANSGCVKPIMLVGDLNNSATCTTSVCSVASLHIHHCSAITRLPQDGFNKYCLGFIFMKCSFQQYFL